VIDLSFNNRVGYSVTFMLLIRSLNSGCIGVIMLCLEVDLNKSIDPKTFQ
jgi:hypothetical protein